MSPFPIFPHPGRRAPVDETLYPDQDITDGGFRNKNNFGDTNLNPLIDETTPFDSTIITTESAGGGAFLTECGSPTDEESCVVGLPDFTNPPSGDETFTLTIRARWDPPFAGDTGTAEVELELLQGASTVINTANPIHSLTSSFAQYDEVLSSTEVTNLLTDTSDMRLRIRARGCVTEVGMEIDVDVSMCRLDVSP